MFQEPSFQDLCSGYAIEPAIFFVFHHTFRGLFGFKGSKSFVNILDFAFKIKQSHEVLDAPLHLFGTTATFWDPYYQGVDLPLF